MASINTHIKERADNLFIKYGSDERSKIETSLSSLKSKLKLQFGSDIKSIEEFGSYKRGTILPREYDDYSDIDLLIIFDHASLSVTPNTYRNYLKTFAEKHYSRSAVYKDSPTVVLELNHIKYDLVPCYLDKGTFYNTYYIPNNSNSWMSSDIHGFNSKLTEANTLYNSIVKPIIRLMKAWNAKVGFPYNSYQLEQEVAFMNYSGDNYETGLFWAGNHLVTSGKTYNTISKIESLQTNIQRVKEALAKEDVYLAKAWLNHILP